MCWRDRRRAEGLERNRRKRKEHTSHVGAVGFPLSIEFEALLEGMEGEKEEYFFLSVFGTGRFPGFSDIWGRDSVCRNDG